MIQIGILGCGTIGTAVAEAVEKKFSRFARLSFICDIHAQHAEKLCRKLKIARPRIVSVSELIEKSDLIVEAASTGAAGRAIPKALRAGKQILVLSVGGVLKIKNLTKLVDRSCGCIYIPSGAIPGVDAMLAAKLTGIRKVQITTRKPVRGLKSSPFFSKKRFELKSIRKPKLIFEGTALKAIKNFPENVNVAATLSLAGIGPTRTRVRVITSPSYRYNTHEIEVEGGFGKFVCQTTNFPSKENPKTSSLAVSSAVATLEKIFNQIKIGT